MRSVLGGLASLISNKAPIAYVGRSGGGLRLPFGGNRRDQVAEMSAMGSVGTLFSIVTTNANAVSQVEWHLFRSAKSGKKEDRTEVTSHLALDIWRKPNPFYTGQLFRETFSQHLELVGEGWWVVARDPRARSIPLELWPVRPDRITPVPSPTDYLSGYIYTSPDGEQVPLGLDEVIPLRMPNPLDPYRGMGAVQSLLADLDSARYSAEWNRNFFLNGAEPGGIVEVEQRLDDDEFTEMVTRWREQHQGVVNAHRVAILERGKWVDRKFSMRDMQFAELRSVSRDVIREAFSMPKFALGDVTDVNRANAEASAAWYAEHITKPRLERIRNALNFSFLPLFGTAGQGLEWDYDDPTPANSEAEIAERDSKVAALEALIVRVGVKSKDAFQYLDMPEMEVKVPEPPPAPMLPGAPPAQPKAPARPQDHWHAHTHALLTAAAEPAPEDVDLSQVQADWEQALEQLLITWGAITAAQRAELVPQIVAAVAAGTPAALAALTVTSAGAAAVLAAAMIGMAAIAAGRVVGEAAAQGVTTAAGAADAALLATEAEARAALLANSLATTAGREALRHYTPGADGHEVAAAVDAHLAGMSDAGLRAELGGALTAAQNEGRIATLKVAPEGALYASEQNDKNTCAPCRAVDGRWLGNTSDLTNVNAMYPAGGYIDCLGRERCRGTIVGVWRPKQVKRGDT